VRILERLCSQPTWRRKRERSRRPPALREVGALVEGTRPAGLWRSPRIAYLGIRYTVKHVTWSPDELLVGVLIATALAAR
jgi:hypothetical protein